MRRLLLLFCLSSALVFSADSDFNGRWDITVHESARKRAWWLEVSGAGTPNVSGMFVGAPGGQLDKIPEIKVDHGELRFEFKRRYREGNGDTAKIRVGVYRARLVGGNLEGAFELQDETDVKKWTGVRAPKLAAQGKWREGKPIELFNGKDLSGWKPLLSSRPMAWTVKDGTMKNDPGATDLVTDQKFWNFKLRAEYRVGPKSNSGIGLRGRYEVQIYDDFGEAPSMHGNGALYSRYAPSQNASNKPGEWQAFDITLIGNVVTVVLNGTTIIDHREIEGLTAIATDPNEGEPGPIVIQGDHGSVEFRKVTLTPMVKGS